MRMYDIIHKKRDGGELSNSEISYVINGYTKGEIPDYQMSAFAMTVFYKGMNDRETGALTDAMARSGDMVDLSRFRKLSVDKHSTGGVGDKTTLIVVPIVAALGGKVAKMSGRGLGHTGGTVDKLESIEGYKTTMSPEAFLTQVDNIGVAVIGQSGNLAPADKKLYALRDVTATVDSIPLIASSIMSKKIAAGAHSIVLDVKVGSGAFMKTEEEAVKLAEKMVDIGFECKRQVTALITNNDIPLGYAIGNALEVKEAIAVLKGESYPDLTKVCVALSSNMLSLCHGWDIKESEEKVLDALNSGKAFDKFKEWITAQGGNVSWIDNINLFPQSAVEYHVKAQDDMDAEKIGIAGVMLGAGRERKDDFIDPSAGIILKAKVGDYVKKSDVIADFYTNKAEKIESALEQFLSALKLGQQKPVEQPLIYRTITRK